jgi:crossover junction endodeoxyribonuclease RuvC
LSFDGRQAQAPKRWFLLLKMRVLGIDPGSDTTGWGVIEGDGRHYRLIEYGAIRSSPRQKFPTRLLHISNGIEEVIACHRPEACAIEDGFLATNVRVTLKLGQVRGVAMLVAERAALETYEYSPRLVKQTVVGYGNAEKHQVQEMVRILLSLASAPEPQDAADALAVAICHFHHAGITQRIIAAEARIKLTASAATRRRVSR